MSEFNPHLARVAVKYIKEGKHKNFPFLPAELAEALVPYVFIPAVGDKAPEKSIETAKTESMFAAAMREESYPIYGKEMLRNYVWTHVTLEALVKFEQMIRADCAAKGEKK